MDKAHEVADVSVAGATLRMTTDGRPYEIDLTAASSRLTHATDAQRANLCGK